MAAAPWIGHLTVGSGWALFLGTPGDNELHAHQALQLCISGGEPLTVTSEAGPRRREPAVAIATRVAHSVQAGAGPAAFLYLEPDGAEGRAVAQAIGAGGIAAASGPAASALGHELAAIDLDAHEPARAARLREEIVALWRPASPEPPPAACDERVERARRIVRERLGEPRVPAAELARAVGLSASRLAHLFRRETGVPLRAFVLWARLQRAVEEVAAGRSLTDAALEAGFADAAHLARTFRRMFGTTVTLAVGQLRIDVVRT